jgi:microcompartment protein CcmK/EutM
MKFGRVTGSVVAANKAGIKGGCKILVVQCLDELLKDAGRSEACIDTMGAGSGDIVLLVSSSSARQTELTKRMCTDNTIAAIVDTVSSGGKIVYKSGRQSADR